MRLWGSAAHSQVTTNIDVVGAAYMEPGHAMQTRDGKTVVMNGNEVARFDKLLSKNRIGG